MVLLFHILLFCLKIQVTIAQRINFVIPTYGNALTAAVTDIIGNFYVKDTNTVNIYQEAQNEIEMTRHYDMINEVLYHMVGMDISVRIEDKALLKAVRKKRVHNIVFIDTYESFLNFFEDLSTNIFEYQGFYLIVLTTYTYEQYSIMTNIFKFLWTEYIVDVNIIWNTAQNNNEAFMYTYFPFTNFYCGKSYPVQLNQYSFGRWLNNQSTKFPNKMSNLHTCPLTAAVIQTGPFMRVINKTDGTIQLDGIEGTVLSVVSELMNFTLKVITTSEQGGFFKNGTATGAGKLITDGIANLSLGYFSMTEERNTYMKPSYIYYTSNLVWIVPNGRLYTSFEKLAKPFTFLTWFCVLVILLGSFVVVFLLNLRSHSFRHFVYGRNIKTPCLNIANIFFGGSLHALPTRNFARTLIGMFMIYSLVIRSSYQGALFNFMKGDFREEPVNDLRTMIDQDFTFYVVESSVDNVKNLPDVVKRSSHRIQSVHLYSSPKLLNASNQSELDEYFQWWLD
ncbi:ionotropic receptor 21a-like [Chironomus tepperi]|uniref:ionotropic receptor 21a-like n=1 Tax=Chironomus tepperi TaxID=113505 RepID=UPI00391F8C4E